MKRYKCEYVAIDQGSDSSLAAYMDGISQESVCCSNPEGGFLTPSYFYFPSYGDYVFGKNAKDNKCLKPERVVDDYKKDLGKKKTCISVDENDITAEDLYCYGLKEMHQIATLNMGNTPKGAVVTVPTKAGHAFCKAAEEAAKKAGIKEVFLLSEGSAPLYHYIPQDQLKGKIAVIDCGGRTLDISVAEVGKNVIDIIYADGNMQCGGKDFTESLEEYVKQTYLKGKNLDLYETHKLKECVEDAKVMLSKRNKVRMVLYVEGDVEEIVITREEFEECTIKWMEVVRSHLFPLTEMDLDKICLAGGGSRMYLIQNLVKELFPEAEILNDKPEEAIVRGAAVYANLLYQKKSKFKLQKSFEKREMNVISTYSYGIATRVGVKGQKQVFHMIKKDSQLPAKVEKTFFTKEENQKQVILQIYETDKKEDFTRIRKEEYLGEAILDIHEDLPIFSEIKVRFELDKNGVLHVSGEEPKFGSKVDIELKGMI